MDLADVRGRDDSFESALAGTSTQDPRPDYAEVAEAFDISGYGPIADPSNLQETLSTAWKEAESGKPVVVDVHCQPR